MCLYSINAQKIIVHSDFEIRIETKQSSNQLPSSNVINIVGRRHKVMIVSCVFRCIMHVYIDRVRKQILETIGLMTTFLICGAAFSFCVSHHCYSNTVKYLSTGPETILLKRFQSEIIGQCPSIYYQQSFCTHWSTTSFNQF